MKDHIVTAVTSVLLSMGLFQATDQPPRVLEVDRLIVREELIVSDTGEPWERGFERQQIARGLYVRSLHNGVAGLWIRSRIIKTEIDDPFDDRFHAINRDGTPFSAPGHISWNVWANDAWRQMAIIQGERLDHSETPLDLSDGGTHPGRLRFQTFRPGHHEPMTDILAGQGLVSIGGGGYGGGGLPFPSKGLDLWGVRVTEHALQRPETPRVIEDDGSGEHHYAIVAIGPQGDRTDASQPVKANGLATLVWDSVAGADSYLIMRDGTEIDGPVRIEGSSKQWVDAGSTAEHAR